MDSINTVKKTRFGIRRKFVAISLVGALTIVLAGALPADATGGQPVPRGATGIAAALPVLVTSAPSSFKQQLRTYLQGQNQVAKAASGVVDTSQLKSQAQTALKVMNKATSTDWAYMNFAFSKIPNWQQGSKQIKTALAIYSKTKRLDSIPAGGIRNKDISKLGCSFDPTASIYQKIAFLALYQIISVIDEIIADSENIVLLGEGITIPISPFKLITYIPKTIAGIVAQISNLAYNIYFGCEEIAHRDQMDNLNSYIKTNNPPSTVAIHVTNVGDTYHYQFTIHKDGQLVDPNTEKLYAISLPTSGPATAQDISDQVSFTRLDTGLYQFTIPPSAVGAAYRLKVEYDNGQDANGNTLAYIGDSTFTKSSQ